METTATTEALPVPEMGQGVETETEVQVEVAGAAEKAPKGPQKCAEI